MNNFALNTCKIIPFVGFKSALKNKTFEYLCNSLRNIDDKDLIDMYSMSTE